VQESGSKRLYTIFVSVAVAVLALLIIAAVETYSTHDAPLKPSIRSDETATGYLVLAGVLVMLWGVSSFYRCTDAYIKRNLLVTDALLLLWMLASIICETASGIDVVRYSEYSFSIPLLYIPMMMLFNALHVSALDYRRGVRVAMGIVFGICTLLVLAIFTNDLYAPYLQLPNIMILAIGFAPTSLQLANIVWGLMMLAAAGIVLIVASRFRPRVIVGVLLIVAVLVTFFAFVNIFQAYSLFDSNISLSYAVFVSITTEVCFQTGIISSYFGFDALFAKLPFDLKLLAKDKDLLFRTRYKTDAATPLLAEEKERLVRLEGRREENEDFRIPAVPNRLYRAYKIPGGIALLSADSTVLTAEMTRLEERQEMLKQQVNVLEQRNKVQERLRQQERERELFEDIESSLRSATTAIKTIIASLSASDTPEGRARRRQQLLLVKLLVAYCKRKGSLVLATKGGADFDRDRLMVIINEIITDMRTAGAECAAIVEVDVPLSSHTVNKLYDCLYDFVTIAFQHPDPLIMVFVQTSDDGAVRLRAQLEDQTGVNQVQQMLADQLEQRLTANWTDHQLDVDEDSMRLNVTLPAEVGGSDV